MRRRCLRRSKGRTEVRSLSTAPGDEVRLALCARQRGAVRAGASAREAGRARSAHAYARGGIVRTEERGRGVDEEACQFVAVWAAARAQREEEVWTNVGQFHRPPWSNQMLNIRIGS